MATPWNLCRARRLSTRSIASPEPRLLIHQSLRVPARQAAFASKALPQAQPFASRREGGKFYAYYGRRPPEYVIDWLDHCSLRLLTSMHTGFYICVHARKSTWTREDPRTSSVGTRAMRAGGIEERTAGRDAVFRRVPELGLQVWSRRPTSRPLPHFRRVRRPRCWSLHALIQTWTTAELLAAGIEQCELASR